jgi:endo-1,4-beta-xylanase
MFRDGGEFTGDWRDNLRGDSQNPRAVSHWYLAYENGADKSKGESGADYLYDAFYLARKHDPVAILYCNEYNEEYPVKREAIAHMIEDINGWWSRHPEYDGRLLIEGIGMQFHCNHTTNIDNIRLSFERFIKTGARISVTELDITFGSKEEPANPLTPEQSKRQAEMYAEMFRMFIEYSKYIERVTFWGWYDGHSWRSWGSPLLFDGNCQAKEAYYAVVDVVK